MFATAVINKMLEVDGTRRAAVPKVNDEGEEEDLLPEQEESYAEFARSVYNTLLQDVDRRGYEHEFTFKAQDDAWSMCWRERTGIPLADFEERWNSLPDWEADQTLHPGDPQNRDPSVTKQQRKEYLELEAKPQEGTTYKKTISGSLGRGQLLGKRQRQSSDLYGGDLAGLKEEVKVQAKDYLSSYQGFDDTGEDGQLHDALHEILRGRLESAEALEFAHAALKNRMTQIAMADHYLSIMELPPPKDCSCFDYDVKNWAGGIPRPKHGALTEMFRERTVLFPTPISEVDNGRTFAKPREYLIAAFHFANVSKQAVVEKLDILVELVENDVERTKESIKREPEVRSKRRRLFESVGERFRSMSPTKRRSRGESLSEGKSTS